MPYDAMSCFSLILLSMTLLVAMYFVGRANGYSKGREDAEREAARTRWQQEREDETRRISASRMAAPRTSPRLAADSGRRRRLPQ